MVDELKTIGEELRKAREDRSLTLDEIEIQTKIRAKFIENLENGDLEALPSHAHARGFLRNYAQFLYLDANELVSRFNIAIGSENKVVTTLTATSQPAVSAFTRDQFEGDDQGRGRERKTTFVPSTKRQGPAAPRVSTREEIEESRTGPFRQLRKALKKTGVEEDTSSVSEQKNKVEEGDSNFREILRSPYFSVGAFLLTGLVLIIWITISLSRLNVDALVPTPQESDILNQFDENAGTMIVPTAIRAVTDTPESTSGAPQVYDRVALTISVESRAWTKITVDGVIEFEGQADPGTILQYEGTESIVLLTGNAAGLNITFNGQKLGPMGERGQIVERIYTVAGAVTPTPSPTPTATNTAVPTRTPNP